MDLGVNSNATYKIIRLFFVLAKKRVMQKQFVLLFVFLIGISGAGLAQSTRDVKTKPNPPAPRYQATKKEKKGFFLFRIFQKKQSESSEVEQFRANVRRRIQKRAKEEQKAANNPQYSNPLYFGHKKPPKKRKVGKKKFCKECGLVN